MAATPGDAERDGHVLGRIQGLLGPEPALLETVTDIGPQWMVEGNYDQFPR